MYGRGPAPAPKKGQPNHPLSGFNHCLYLVDGLHSGLHGLKLRTGVDFRKLVAATLLETMFPAVGKDFPKDAGLLADKKLLDAKNAIAADEVLVTKQSTGKERSRSLDAHLGTGTGVKTVAVVEKAMYVIADFAAATAGKNGMPDRSELIAAAKKVETDESEAHSVATREQATPSVVSAAMLFDASARVDASRSIQTGAPDGQPPMQRIVIARCNIDVANNTNNAVSRPAGANDCA